MDDDFGEVVALHGDTISAADDGAIQALVPRLPAHPRRVAAAAGRPRAVSATATATCTPSTSASRTEPLIFDCIEFNPAFRYRDVAAEIAFLAMDLDLPRSRRSAPTGW